LPERVRKPDCLCAEHEIASPEPEGLRPSYWQSEHAARLTHMELCSKKQHQNSQDQV